MTAKNNYALIMAGGVGTRFWPASTPDFPKQFHDMLGTGESLLQATFKRFEKFIPPQHIFVLTHARYEKLVMEQLPNMESAQIVCEPALRNTAPCLTYAAMKIAALNAKARMIVAPSDHWIEDEAAFTKDMEFALAQADAQRLITFGITPHYPATGYGYIEAALDLEEQMTLVKRFVEKPNLNKAKDFLASGHFLWNAGIFVWQAHAFLSNMQKCNASLYALFEQGKEAYNTVKEKHFIETHYPKAASISIDYALLEKAEHVYVIQAAFDWNDLGTWRSLYEQLAKKENGNVAIGGEVYFENATGNLIKVNPNKKVIVARMKDFLVVDTDEILMIYPKEKDQEIKQLQEKVGKI